MKVAEDQIEIDFTGCWWVCRYDTCSQERGVAYKSVDFTMEDRDLFALVEIKDPGKPSEYVGKGKYTNTLPAEAPRPQSLYAYVVEKDIIEILVKKCKSSCDNVHPKPQISKKWRFWVLIGTDAWGRLPESVFVHYTNRLKRELDKACVDPTSHLPIIDACIVTNLDWWNKRIGHYPAKRI